MPNAAEALRRLFLIAVTFLTASCSTQRREFCSILHPAASLPAKGTLVLTIVGNVGEFDEKVLIYSGSQLVFSKKITPDASTGVAANLELNASDQSAFVTVVFTRSRFVSNIMQSCGMAHFFMRSRITEPLSGPRISGAGLSIETEYPT